MNKRKAFRRLTRAYRSHDPEGGGPMPRDLAIALGRSCTFRVPLRPRDRTAIEGFSWGPTP